MMMNPDYVPPRRLLALLFGGAVVLLGASAALIIDDSNHVSGFLPFLIGMVLLFVAATLLLLRTINRRHPASSD